MDVLGALARQVVGPQASGEAAAAVLALIGNEKKASAALEILKDKIAELEKLVKQQDTQEKELVAQAEAAAATDEDLEIRGITMDNREASNATYHEKLREREKTADECAQRQAAREKELDDRDREQVAENQRLIAEKTQLEAAAKKVKKGQDRLAERKRLIAAA